ncbi:alginate O-acetyltransferase AlgX-related protein [Bradyrhizobium sp. WSM471]|uniref:alginate O-acetyltransferase AlgX-related protein n=1 Tax=Bradyrhizobium sp. WSM471 TaxID=319017 RepID=UPI0012FA58DB|nr:MULTISPECIES: hypothetical protein [Bradyrhizobium]UFW43393.1 hypothetical protein BcanWSM471_10035 [Bradyrhizobium canariense]
MGSDGWLFLADGSNDVRKLYTELSFLSQDTIHGWRQRLIARQERLLERQVKYLHVWVPEKLSIYRDHIGPDFPLLQHSPADRIWCNELSGFVLNLIPAFAEEKQRQQLYWKTDTHWTFAGAYRAYLEICKALGASPDLMLRTRPIHHIELTLDLGSKLNPPVKELWGSAQLLNKSRIVFKNEMVRFLELLNGRLQANMHTGTSIGYDNPASLDNRRVLLFGDSYSEYRPHLLSGLLAETFRAVQFVWSASIDYELVDRFKADIVISEMAERFVTRAPADDMDLTKLVHDRIVSFLNKECAMSKTKFSWNVG